jgi:hypothetical protein
MHTGSIQFLPNMMPSMLLITMNLVCTLALSLRSSKHAMDTKEQGLELDADFIPLDLDGCKSDSDTFPLDLLDL